MLRTLCHYTWQSLLQVKLYLHFAYACFIRPFLPFKADASINQGSESNLSEAAKAHQNKLERFYSAQASVYDASRHHLLKGREQCLQLCASYLLDLAERKSFGDKWIWVDIGGGTGFNIETMSKYMDVTKIFERIYLVDLTPSLCEEARKRFYRLGWKNVTVICGDAATWEVPIEDEEKEKVMLNTFSYSLSMMPLPTVFKAIDMAPKRLSEGGILGIVDFLAENKGTFSYPDGCSNALSFSYASQRYISYFSRVFWQWWFELDGVHLHPCRRDYVMHMMNQQASNNHGARTLKVVYGKNLWAGIPFIRIPYYVWVGIPKEFNASERMQRGNMERWCVQETSDDEEKKEDQVLQLIYPEVGAKGTMVKQNKHWREAYEAEKSHKIMSTYLYAFVWEDPSVDLDYFDLRKDDNVLLITSGGCNALEYLINKPITLQCVDLNPCQNHLFELKLAAIKSLSHQDLWQLLGVGHHGDFRTLLNTKLSCHLSQHAYNFWLQNINYFDPPKNCEKASVYMYGGSGLAMRAFQWLIKFMNLQSTIEKLCETDSLEEQYSIWINDIKPKIFHPVVVRVLNNPWFLWNGLGVPRAQMSMLMAEGGAMEYISATFDPLMKSHLLSKDSYFYYLCLNLRYRSCTEGGAPTYLTKEGHAVAKSRLDNISIHTDTIENVCLKIAAEAQDESLHNKLLTKAVILDHMDWMDENLVRAELKAMSACMVKGGKVFWRSAAREPWYNQVFEDMGFKVNLIHRRPQHGSPCKAHEQQLLDRVNMYACFYVATKM